MRLKVYFWINTCGTQVYHFLRHCGAKWDRNFTIIPTSILRYACLTTATAAYILYNINAKQRSTPASSVHELKFIKLKVYCLIHSLYARNFIVTLKTLQNVINALCVILLGTHRNVIVRLKWFRSVVEMANKVIDTIHITLTFE